MKWNVGLITGVTAMAALCGSVLHAGVVFEDGFTDLSAWTVVEETGDDPVIESALAVDHAPYLHLPYRTIKADLSEPISTFKISWKWLPADWRQVGYLLVTNSDGTQGYGVRWNSAHDDPGYEPGYVNIAKWDNVVEPDRLKANLETTYLLAYSEYISGNSVDLPFADFRLELDSTGLLTLRVADPVHGVHKYTATDTAFSSFSKIYLTTSYYSETPSGFYVDELRVSPYEPVTCEEAVGGGYAIRADLNGDCYVNWADFSVFAADWLRCNDPEDPGCESTW